MTQLWKDFAIALPAAEMERRPITGWPDGVVQVAFEVKGTGIARYTGADLHVQWFCTGSAEVQR